MNIGGIDIGTSGVKCAVYNEEGKCVAFSRKAYSYAQDDRGFCLNPCIVWESVKQVLKETAEKCRGEIDGLAVSSIGESCILLDNQDRVLGNSILYNDKRGIAESRDFISEFGEEKIYARCGISSNGTYSAEKLRWISKNTDYFEKVDKIFLYEDFIIYRLTGQRNISYSLASRTMLFDITTKEWIPEFLSFAGFKPEHMSEPVDSGTEAGEIKNSFIKEFGLKRKTKIFTGGHDHLCCTLGAGMVLSGTGVNISGSGDTVSFLLEQQLLNADMQKGGYSCSPYIGERYATYGLCAMSGTLLRWYKAFFGEKRTNFYSEIEKQILDIKTDVILIPSFTIMGTPDFKLNSTGIADGFTLKTSPAELYKGILEGIAFHLKLNLDFLNGQGIKNDKIHVVGGGANSDVWNQIKADIWGMEVVKIRNSEAGTAGCAILAGVGMGLFKDYEEASLKFIKTDKVFCPEASKTKENDEKYERFLNLYHYKKRMEDHVSK